MNINTETSAHLSTVERSSRRTTPARPRPQGRVTRRLAGPGWVIMTLACVSITVIASDAVLFSSRRYPCLAGFGAALPYRIHPNRLSGGPAAPRCRSAACKYRVGQFLTQPTHSMPMSQ
jgi:hypothetical protein